MKNYTVVHGSILLDDTLYQEGDAISLTDSQAKDLAIHLGKPEAKAKTEPAPEPEADHG